MDLSAGVRTRLHASLQAHGLYDRAREVLREYAAKGSSTAGRLKDVFDLLSEAGLVDEVSGVMHELNVDPATLEGIAREQRSVATVGREASASARTEPSSPSRAAESSQSRQHSPSVGPSQRSTFEAAGPAATSVRRGQSAGPQLASYIAADPGRPLLLVRFDRGRAFVPPQALSGDIAVGLPGGRGGRRTAAGSSEAGSDDGAEVDDDAGDDDGMDAALALEAAAGVRRAYVLHAFCAGQRFHSEPVPMSLEPDFGGAAVDFAAADRFSAGGSGAGARSGTSSDGGAFERSVQHSPQFVVDLVPILAGDFAAAAASGTAVSGFAAAGAAGLPLPRKLLQGTTLESAGLHLVLTLVTDRGGAAGAAASSTEDAGSAAGHVSVDLVASHTLDWRSIVSAEGLLTSLVPLAPAGPGPHPTTPDGSGARIPVGLLPVSLYLRPLLEPSKTVPRWDAEHALSRSAAARTEAAQAFLRYAKRWWGEFKSVHPSFKARAVKIFGENERGEFLPVCSYVAPLAAGRLLETPSHAARFVSLIPFRRDESLAGSSGGGSGARRELWLAPHVTLALRQGDVEAHAALLCSLLLGFGLEAYVALGSRLDAEGREGEYAWVVTRYAEAPAPSSAPASTPSSVAASAAPTAPSAGERRGEASSDAESGAAGGAAATPGYDPHATVAASGEASAAPRARVVFWDPLTGQRSDPAAGPSAAGFSYYRLAAVFNHLSFHANQALHDGAAAVRWGDWADATQWKTMDPAMLLALPRCPVPPLSPPSLDPLAVSDAVEAALRSAITAYRRRTRHSILDVCRQQWRTPPVVAAQRLAGGGAFGAAGLSAGPREAVGASMRQTRLGAASRNPSVDQPGVGVTGPPRADGATVGELPPEEEQAASVAAIEWDAGLEHRLQMALASYEMERAIGAAAGGDDFASSVRGFVPRGYSFRGFPICFNHISPARMLETLLGTPAARDILEAPSDSETIFALKARVHVFPEDTTAAWVMLAVCQPVMEAFAGSDRR